MGASDLQSTRVTNACKRTQNCHLPARGDPRHYCLPPWYSQKGTLLSRCTRWGPLKLYLYSNLAFGSSPKAEYKHKMLTVNVKTLVADILGWKAEHNLYVTDSDRKTTGSRRMVFLHIWLDSFRIVTYLHQWDRETNYPDLPSNKLAHGLGCHLVMKGWDCRGEKWLF